MPITNIDSVLGFLVLILFHERLFSDKAILDHIKFSYECFDRFITNCISRRLQYERGLSYYLFENYGAVSRDIVKARTDRIHKQMEQLAMDNNIEIKTIKIGTSLLKLAQQELQKLQPISDDSDFIVAIFKQLDYGNSWNFDSNEKVLRRKIRRVYHYTVYHFDKDFGLGSHTINTYLPNNIRGYFNQHNWLIQQLKQQQLWNEDIRMYYNSFQDIGSIEYTWFQNLCDSLSFDDIVEYNRKWIYYLWDELSNLDYDIYINEAEFCSNIVFKQKSFLNTFYINHTLYSYELNHPDNLSFVFKRRIDRRYRNEFKTKLQIVETKPCLKISYKSQQYKEYLKGCVLRSESTVNNSRDIGLKKQDFKDIREACRDINERAMSIKQPIDPNWIQQELDHNPFERVMVGKKWIPGLKINDEKTVSVMKGLLQLSVNGIRMRELTDFVNQDLGLSDEDGYSIGQIGYIVRKLRGHGIAEKVFRKNLYRLTTAGECFVRMFLPVIEKILIPVIQNVNEKFNKPKAYRKEYQSRDTKSDHLKKLDGIYKNLERDLDSLFDHFDIIISPNAPS